MSKTLALIAVALGLVAASAGSALAGGNCGGSQSVSLETQTASTGDTHAPYTPVPESNSN